MALDFFEVAKKITQFTAAIGVTILVESAVKQTARPTGIVGRISVPVASWFLAGLLIEAVKGQVTKEFDEVKETIGVAKEIIAQMERA